MKMSFNKKYLLPIVPFFFIGCAEPEIPAFLYADSFSFNCELSSQGYNSEKITDGWLYVNGELLGVYELPALIPVLANGDAEIVLLPGIKENGISVFSITYPFYDAYDVNVVLSAGNTDTLMPFTTYFSEGLNFIVDRFESGNIFSSAINSDTSFYEVSDTAEVFEGLRSMHAELEGGNYFFRAQTYELLLPDDGRECFLELDYKNDTECEVWLSGIGASGSEFPEYVISLNPKENWNKVYINLGDIARLIQTETYKLELRMSRPETAARAVLYIDNVKIIWQE
ncbi:MAG: hypothetical protein ACKVPJ_12100 [Chitinophagales bacterium]